LNVTINDQEGCKKQVRLIIPGEKVRAESDKIVGDLARRVSLPGFRPGHVPKSVIRTRFQKEVRDEVISQLLPAALRDAIREHELKVVGEPELDGGIKFDDDDSMDVTFVVEVAPEFMLSDHKNLSITKTVHTISDRDVDNTIQRLRRQHAELVPVEDRPSQHGDTVTAAMKGRIEDLQQPGEPKEISEPELEVDLDEHAMKEFTGALTGVVAGDTREFTVDYPADYGSERLAGKRVAYTAEVTAVRLKELPEVDDEFAQLVGNGCKTIAELRQRIRTELDHAAEHETKEKFESAVMEALVARNQFAVPEYAVERQMDQRMRTMIRQMAARGIDARKLKLDWEALRESHRERAEREVRGLFILARIAELEKIDVTEAELNDELEKAAAGQSVAALKARLTKENGLDSIKEQIKHRKALELVVSSADIRTVEVEGLGGTDSGGEGRPGGEGDRVDKGLVELK
jgi:trigger factor